MRTYPIPFNDPARLEALRHLPGLTPGSEPLFDGLTDMARQIFDCPVAHVSVVEEDRQWFKTLLGAELPEIPRDWSFCSHAIMSDAPMIIPDLSQDPRFVDHPMVVNEPHVRFYAGVPLVLSNGFRVGTLCALDMKPHAPPSEAQVKMLVTLTETLRAALERAPEPAPEEAEEEEDYGRAEFVALIGHELRTPLTVMMGSTRLLEARVEGAIEKRMAQAAFRSCQHLHKLIETIIAYSDAATGDLRLNDRQVALGDLVEELVETHGPTLEAAGKTLDLDGLALDGHLIVDREQAMLALAALVNNAALHGGGTLALSSRQDANGEIEILITDDGKLSDHVQLEELYKPFVVGGNLDTRRVGGLGLGLPLTRKIVELHGGEFEVRAGEDSTAAVIRLPAWRRVQG